MKRFLFFTIACLSSIWGMAQIATDTYVEVLYFHGKQRCATCKAIDKHTKEVVNADLAELVKNGKLRFKEIDISTPEGEKLAEKYCVSWSSLYVNKWKKIITWDTVGGMFASIVEKFIRSVFQRT